MLRGLSDGLAPAVVNCQGAEGGGKDSALFLTHLQMTRVVMSSPGRGTHLREGVCRTSTKGPPPQANPDPLSPEAPARAQATPFRLREPVQTQVRPADLVMWGAEMGSGFPGVTQSLPQTQQRDSLQQAAIIWSLSEGIILSSTQ